MSTLGRNRITEVTLFLPAAGGWRADVIMNEGDVPTGIQTLTVAGLALKGKVLRSAFDLPGRPRAVVVGGLGWQSNVTSPLSFQSDAGVRLSTVLAALAQGAGEPIEQPKDTTIGDYYECLASRPGEPVRFSDALADLVRGGYIASWRVDPDGVTRFGARTAIAVTDRLTQLSSDNAAGIAVYGADSAVQLLPGNTIAGVPIAQVDIIEVSEHLEAHIKTTETTAQPSIRDSIRRMVMQAFNDILRTYVVSVTHADGRMDLSPPSDATHLPDMKNVEQWVMGGVVMRASPGDEVLVMFRDERKTRPVVCGFKLGTGPFLDVARVTDLVNVFLPAGAPITGIISPPGTTFTGTFTTPVSCIGTIQIGSQKVGAKT